jgi:outer membrane protein assembly factor BamA
VCTSEAPQLDRISRVELRGASSRELCERLRTKAGAAIDAATVNTDIHGLFASRRVADVIVEREAGAEIVVVYHVREYPRIVDTRVTIDGVNMTLEQELRAAIPLLDWAAPGPLRRGADQLRERLADAGFKHASVTPTTQAGADGVRVLWKIVAGRPLTIRSFAARGNVALSTAELAQMLPSLQPGRVVRRDETSHEILRLQAWYYDRGLVNVHVDDVAFDERASDDTAAATVTIREGDVFQLGAVHFSGTLAAPEAEYAKAAALTSGAVFSRTAIIEARQRAQAFHAQHGGKGEPTPSTSIDNTAHRIDLTFEFGP